MRPTPRALAASRVARRAGDIPRAPASARDLCMGSRCIVVLGYGPGVSASVALRPIEDAICTARVLHGLSHALPSKCGVPK